MRRHDDSTQIHRYIELVLAGHAAARDDLLAHCRDRLTRLTRKMLRDFPGVKRWEETDDVFQNAAVRLCRALEEVRPSTSAAFFRLAAVQIRRELLDLARRYSGRPRPGAACTGDFAAGRASGSAVPFDPADTTHDPDRLSAWTEFHRAVESLPAEERDVFDLLFYQGLSQAEAAVVLEISGRTLKRRWQSARLKVAQAMGGRMPGL
jgi:RNA polymerase sigma factor (sigma-70 family)